MEGLTVEASVAGLLEVSDKAIDFLSNVPDAPHIARDLLAEVEELRVIFRRLETFLASANHGEIRQDRASQVEVDDLVTILTGTVCTFSELDGVLEQYDGGDGKKNRRPQWGRQSLDRISRNLHSQKRPLDALLSIMMGDEALPESPQTQIGTDEFKAMVANLLLDPDVARRMRSFAATAVDPDASSAVTRSTVRPRAATLSAPVGDGASILTESSHRTPASFHRAFEKTLVKSRVYKKVTRKTSIDSFHTTDTMSTQWSQVSGLSLAQLSNISIVCLPVYIVELNNGHMYQQKAPSGIGSGDGSFATATLIRLQCLRQGGLKISTMMRLRLLSPTARVSLLHTSAKSGDVDTIKMLIDNLKVNPDALDDLGNAALHDAVTNGHIAATRQLLDCGADINVMDNDGMSPLHHAASHGSESIVRLLLDLDANIEATEKRGRTPLHFAASDVDGSSLQARPHDSDVAVHTPGRVSVHDNATPKKLQDTIRLPLHSGTTVTTTDLAHDSEPLPSAAPRRKPAVMRLLLDRGANIDAGDLCGSRPLDFAEECGIPWAVKMLVEHAYDVAGRDDNTNTRLPIAPQ